MGLLNGSTRRIRRLGRGLPELVHGRRNLGALVMPAKITDTVETFTIRQVAELWGDETGERPDIIERALIAVASRSYSKEEVLDHETELVFVRLDAKNKDLSPEELEEKVAQKEKELLENRSGLYVPDLQGDVSPDTEVSRHALLAWCEQNDLPSPKFLAKEPRRQTKGKTRRQEGRRAATEKRNAGLQRVADRIWTEAWDKGGIPLTKGEVANRMLTRDDLQDLLRDHRDRKDKTLTQDSLIRLIRQPDWVRRK